MADRFTSRQKQRAAGREVAQRQRVYPRLVDAGKMKQADANLQIEIMCTNDESRLEALVRSRRSPYLCKIERAGDFSLEAEMISACGYLDGQGECALHGRMRQDGTTAKPDLCFDWPKGGEGEHPGCVFIKK